MNTDFNTPENLALVDRLRPYAQYGKAVGLSDQDAVFFAFWVDREVWLTVAKDPAFSEAMANVVYNKARGEEVNPEDTEVCTQRVQDAKRFILVPGSTF